MATHQRRAYTSAGEKLCRHITLSATLSSDMSLVVAAASQEISTQDRQHMQHALTLAKKGLGKTYPNPAVGCVIVQQEKVQSMSW